MMRHIDRLFLQKSLKLEGGDPELLMSPGQFYLWKLLQTWQELMSVLYFQVQLRSCPTLLVPWTHCSGSEGARGYY